jgi:hypothetical protein
MNSMVVGRSKSVDVVHSRGGYREPIVVTAPIFYHKNGHYVKPNRVALKYPTFKKDVDPNVHVKVFNFVAKTNVETSEEYIINAFNYRTSNWCHNYMQNFCDYILSKLTHAFCKSHRKTQNHEQIYMELKNIQQQESEKVEVYYEWIHKLAHGLQVPTTNNFLTIMFRVGL